MTAPDASLGGRDTHTLRELIRAIDLIAERIENDWLSSRSSDALAVELRAIAAAGTARLDEARRQEPDPSTGWVCIRDNHPDPVASSPGAPRSNT